MKKYEYQVISPYIKQGKFIDGYTHEKTTGMFGGTKLVSTGVTISEQEWLNRKGEEGWELVHVFRGKSYDIREYYFKREIQP